MFRAFVAAFLALAAVPSQAATLTAIDPTDAARFAGSSKLFTTEMKRDQNVHNSGARGHDIFLRNGEAFAGPSFNQPWGASGSIYDWSLAYDGDIAVMTFAGQSRKLDVSPDGTWNAITFFLQADSPLFSSATTTLGVTSVNGVAAPLTLAVTGTGKGFSFALDRLSALTEVSGTLRFDFVVAPDARGTPNSNLGVSIKALEVTPAAVPVPASLPLLLSGVAAVGLAARRRRRAAA